MTSYLDLDDGEWLKRALAEKSHHLFKASPGKAQLQVSRKFWTQTETGKEQLCSVLNQDIGNISQIKALNSQSNDSSQIFVIRQDHSWTTLNVSRELFEDFMTVYRVFSPFWRHVFTFGIKFFENEFQFPRFMVRRSLASDLNQGEIYESAYVFRSVKRNHGEPQWSIRQTAVYHTFMGSPNLGDSTSKSTSLLIAPSQSLEAKIARFHEMDQRASSPWSVHRMLIADSLSHWMEYMVWLEEQLKEQSNRVLLAQVGTEKEKLSPLTEFNINFADRQCLKQLEDWIIDLKIILSTMLDTIAGLQEQFRKCCKKFCRKEIACDCGLIVEEFDQYGKEVQMLIQRSGILRERANSTAQLLSDLLSYEDAAAMHQLTERSTKDAAQVKILTIITLIYLPTTIVANFFSTQFVQTNDTGEMRLSASSWLLAAIALPLTALTIALWWTWVHCTNVASPPYLSQQPTPPKANKKRILKSFIFSKRIRHEDDLESGMNPPKTIFCKSEISPRSFCDSGVGTWSTTATASTKVE